VRSILVVDDETNLRHTLAYALRQEGYEVLTAEDGEAALESFKANAPDLVILDLMLPKLDGLEVCRRIRRQSDVPILMLTARDSELDRVVGLEIGADDYLVKPFSMRELVARVRAMLRRASRVAEPPTMEVIDLEGLRLDVPKRRVTADGREVALTAKEFDLLAYLAARPGQVLTRDQIVAGVWGVDFSGDPRTVDTHVKTLRERLGDDADRPRWLETVRGVGYRMREGRT
jgi:two-component system, OmpR family, alkaline phosphatase synthesis response regulator PhoP